MTPYSDEQDDTPPKLHGLNAGTGPGILTGLSHPAARGFRDVAGRSTRPLPPGRGLDRRSGR